jgi:hypothetical protein
MPKFSLLFTASYFVLRLLCPKPYLRLTLTLSSSSPAIFLTDFCSRAARFFGAAQAFAGGSPDSSLMVEAA